jgi:hypothetical protein
VYIAAAEPICFRLDWHITAFACFFIFVSAGINIAINNAIIEITTKSSIKVNPLWLLMIIILLPAVKKISSSKIITPSLEFYHIIGRDSSDKWAFFLLQ